jgi:hypothetical protein
MNFLFEGPLFKLTRRAGRSLARALTEALLAMTQLAGTVNHIGLEHVDKLSRIAVAASHGVLQEGQAEVIR